MSLKTPTKNDAQNSYMLTPMGKKVVVIIKKKKKKDAPSFTTQITKLKERKKRA